MTHTTMRAVAVAVGLTICGCSTRDIELRETSRDVSVPLTPRDTEPNPQLEGSPDPIDNENGAEEMPSTGAPLTPTVQPTNGSEALPPVVGLEKGCRKIDFLFVIDNSDSMDDEQANLARSFPGFITVMQRILEPTDFHIMVVSTGGDREDEEEPTLDPAECEEIQGAGRRRSADGDDCGIAGGLPFMVNQQPDLEATFSCVAQVGTDGSAVEEPIDAIRAAIGPLNAAGRCNAGFLREDAILVVTIITDEEDRRSEGEPEEWRQILLRLKGDNEDALVLLGLVGDNNVDGGLLGGPCRAVDADGAPRLQEFVDSVGGVLGSVCATDYTPFFQTAVGSIDSACTDFVRPPIF